MRGGCSVEAGRDERNRSTPYLLNREREVRHVGKRVEVVVAYLVLTDGWKSGSDVPMSNSNCTRFVCSRPQFVRFIFMQHIYLAMFNDAL